MKPMDIMDALGEVPGELVKECFRAPAESSGIRPAHSSPVGIKESGHKPAGIAVPRWFTAAALAACTVFAVGVGAFLISGGRSHEVLQSTEDSAAVPGETEIIQTESAAMVTEPEITAPPVVYAELELHEQEKRVYTWEESDELLKKARERRQQNGGPLLIDTQKYIAKYFSPDSVADINDLEAKSYLYHMMLNSIDYFSTAEGEMVNGVPGSQEYLRFQTDDATHSSYAYSRYDNEGEQETYFSGSDDPFSSFLTNVNLTDKTYTQSYCTVDDKNDFIMSDNDRRTYKPDGTGLAFNRMDGMNLGVPCSCCLFPQDIAMSRLDDFDCWQVTGTAEVLGRTCAAIDGTHSGRTISLLVDVKTGILMQYTETEADSTLRDYSEVTALTVDAPITVKTFDPAGLTAAENFRTEIPASE